MNTDRFIVMEIASLHGMLYMLDEMQERLNSLKQTVRAFLEQREGLRWVAQALNEKSGFGPKRRGRPPGSKNKTGGVWAGMTAEERRAEMLRRRQLGQARRAAGLPPIHASKGRSREGMTPEGLSDETLRLRALLEKAASSRRGGENGQPTVGTRVLETRGPSF